MRNLLLFGAIVLALPLFAQESKPSCNKCSSTYICGDEIQAYLKRVEGSAVADQQVRALDIGKINVDIGVVYRGKLTAPTPQSVA
jgi:positive regulator of sigma E activity